MVREDREVITSGRQTCSRLKNTASAFPQFEETPTEVWTRRFTRNYTERGNLGDHRTVCPRATIRPVFNKKLLVQNEKRANRHLVRALHKKEQSHKTRISSNQKHGREGGGGGRKPKIEAPRLIALGKKHEDQQWGSLNGFHEGRTGRGGLRQRTYTEKEKRVRLHT